MDKLYSEAEHWQKAVSYYAEEITKPYRQTSYDRGWIIAKSSLAEDARDNALRALMRRGAEGRKLVQKFARKFGAPS